MNVVVEKLYLPTKVTLHKVNIKTEDCPLRINNTLLELNKDIHNNGVIKKQINVLKSSFDKCPYLTQKELNRLHSTLSVSKSLISSWFCNSMKIVNVQNAIAAFSDFSRSTEEKLQVFEEANQCFQLYHVEKSHCSIPQKYHQSKCYPVSNTNFDSPYGSGYSAISCLKPHPMAVSYPQDLKHMCSESETALHTISTVAVKHEKTSPMTYASSGDFRLHSGGLPEVDNAIVASKQTYTHSNKQSYDDNNNKTTSLVTYNSEDKDILTLQVDVDLQNRIKNCSVLAFDVKDFLAQADKGSKAAYKHLSAPQFYTCKCGKNFPNLSSLQEHNNAKPYCDKKQIYTCDLCKLSMNQLWRFCRHMRKLHSPKEIEYMEELNDVEDVDIFINTSKHNVVAIKQEIKEEPEDTGIITVAHHRSTQKVVEDDDTLITPSKFYGSSKPVPTPARNGRFDYTSLHQRGKSFQCTYCSKRFKSLVNLNNHSRVHAKEKVHHCAMCNKEFLVQSHLFKHMRSHATYGIKVKPRKLTLKV